MHYYLMSQTRRCNSSQRMIMMMMMAMPSAAFVSTGGYSPKQQLLHTISEMQYSNSNASSSSSPEQEQERDEEHVCIERRHTSRRPRRPPSSMQQQREAMEFTGGGGISSSGITTKHTIDETLCPPTNTNTLQQLVRKHITTLSKYISSKPIAKHNVEAFEEVLNSIITCYNLKQQQRQQQQPTTSRKTKVILDSGCGTGRSSYILGEQNKDCIIIGIDQSLVRLRRNKAYRNSNISSSIINQHIINDDDDEEEGKVTLKCSSSCSNDSSSSNVILVRAELSDFWYLCLSSSQFQQHACIVRHYLLYPNPYPKKSRLQNRFYAHPSFPLLMMTLTSNDDDDDDDIDKALIVRSNWKGYLDEFKVATDVWRNEMIDNNDVVINDWDQDATAIVEQRECRPMSITTWKTSGPDQLNCNISPMTNFEAKFLECGEPIYELAIMHKRILNPLNSK